MKNIVEEYQKDGWVFKYESGTKFIGAYHPNGGKQSICELVNHIESNAFGITIAEFLNQKIN